MTQSTGIGPSRATVAAVTGFWLALTQVSLAFAVLAGAGASALLFFAFTGIWLLGGALGGCVVRGRGVTILLAAAVLSALLLNNRR